MTIKLTRTATGGISLTAECDGMHQWDRTLHEFTECLHDMAEAGLIDGDNLPEREETSSGFKAEVTG